MSYKKIKQDIIQEATKIKDLKEIKHGRTDKIESVFKDGVKTYPVLWFSLENANVNENTIDYIINIDVFGLDDETGRDTENIQDQAILIIANLHFLLESLYDDAIEITSLNPYYIKPYEYVSGCETQITIKTNKTNTLCLI